MLNSAQQNLRFGDATTNKSINNDLDSRLARGLSIEPSSFIEWAWSLAKGSPVLAAETSSFLNGGSGFVFNGGYAGLGAMAQPSMRPPSAALASGRPAWIGGTAMSESATQIATTRTGHFNPVLGAPSVTLSPFRGNLPMLAYSPVSRETLINAFAIWMLYLFLHQLLATF